MKTINMKKGNKASNEQKIEDLNKSKTFRAVESRCKHFLNMEKKIYEEVKSKDMYLTEEEVWKEAEAGEFKKRPVVSNDSIDSLESYNKYFQSKDGLALNWKVVQWYPQLHHQNSAIFMWVWFKALNIILPINYLMVAKVCGNVFNMVTFTAFMQLNIQDVEFFSKKKYKILKDNATIAGFNPLKLTRAQTQLRKEEQINHPKTFTTGFLYDDYQIVEYDPTKVMIKN